MTRAPKRRWFRYSLRTLFVVVTVFGCWLGYELNSIRQRKELLKSLQADSQLSYDPLRTIFVQKGKTKGMRLEETNHGDIPRYRRMLGDEGVVCIGLPSKMTEEDLRCYQNAFPEAYISQDLHLGSIAYPERPIRSPDGNIISIADPVEAAIKATVEAKAIEYVLKNTNYERESLSAYGRRGTKQHTWDVVVTLKSLQVDAPNFLVEVTDDGQAKDLRPISNRAK